uniref:glycosyltransferase family 2 protein n=1 Tax=Pedobacter schmidteae TaxID=2201271 RepID=UPI000EB59ED0|nr:glycosyltransferase family 2 protein [Pedobacter schmidteae]
MFFNKPKVSIITVNYNNKAGLDKTIQSVTSQSYPNIEYIVIDGGSDDGSKAVLTKYNDKLAYAVSEPDKGIYNAMNKGIKVATGEYLLFLNSGDNLIDDQVIEKAVQYGLAEDLVYGDLVYVNGEIYTDWIAEDELTFDSFYEHTIPHPSTFIKRSLFETVGLYNEQLKIVSDWEFFLLATCRYNCSYKHINLPITHFYMDGISADPMNYESLLAERAAVLKRHFPFFLKDYEGHKKIKEQLRKVKKYVKLKGLVKGLFKKQQ